MSRVATGGYIYVEMLLRYMYPVQQSRPFHCNYYDQLAIHSNSKINVVQ